METQCVSAQDIAQAFLQLVHADQWSFVMLLAAVVFVTSVPSLIGRLIDLYEARRQPQADN